MVGVHVDCFVALEGEHFGTDIAFIFGWKMDLTVNANITRGGKCF